MEVVLTVHIHWRKQTQDLKAVNASVCICGSFTKRHVVDSIYSKHRINECLIWKPINKEHAHLQQQNLEAGLKWCFWVTNAIKNFCVLKPQTHRLKSSCVCVPPVWGQPHCTSSTKNSQQHKASLWIILITTIILHWFLVMRIQCNSKCQRKSDAFIDSLIIPASPWERSGGYLTNSNTSHNQ